MPEAEEDWTSSAPGWRIRKATVAGHRVGFLTGTLIEKVLVESQSPTVRELGRIVAEIAPTDVPVLVLGESGTGKEVMALQIHYLSPRCNEPIQKFTCATLGAEAFDRLLQGRNGEGGLSHKFTNTGTIYLDEIGELDPACQTKLLHALPDGDMSRDGHCLGARVISSSSRNLEGEIQAEHFREDLFYRLNEFCLRLPPLRHRKEDIPALLDFFLEKYAAQFARPKHAVSSPALDKLVNYSWPGNIRQLENVAKRIIALGEERLALEDLVPLATEPQSLASENERLSLKQASRAASRQAERELILRTLDRTHWNRKRAALELQISYKALLYKLKQHSG